MAEEIKQVVEAENVTVNDSDEKTEAQEAEVVDVEVVEPVSCFSKAGKWLDKKGTAVKQFAHRHKIGKKVKAGLVIAGVGALAAAAGKTVAELNDGVTTEPADPEPTNVNYDLVEAAGIDAMNAEIDRQLEDVDDSPVDAE